MSDLSLIIVFQIFNTTLVASESFTMLRLLTQFKNPNLNVNFYKFMQTSFFSDIALDLPTIRNPAEASDSHAIIPAIDIWYMYMSF